MSRKNIGGFQRTECARVFRGTNKNVVDIKTEHMTDVVFLDADKKRATIDGVKYIRCWQNLQRATKTTPKCRKAYMVSYRQRKKDELTRLQAIANETDIEIPNRSRALRIINTSP